MLVDPFYLQGLAQMVDQSTNTENSLTSQLASGLRVQQLSDDPTAAAGASMLGSAIGAADTFVQLASSEQSRMQVSDSALGEVVSQLTQALSLAVEGSNGTMNSSNLKAVGQQLAGIRDQVLSLANTSYQGTYLFGGSQGSTAPYTLDQTVTPAVANYAGDSGLEYVRTPSGQQIQVNLAGSSVFGSGATGVMGALNQLVADFNAGASSSTTVADTATLKSALDGVSQQRSVLGSSMSRLQSTSSYEQTQEAQMKAQQSGLVAADTVTVATDLKSAETQHQALISVMSALGSVNLFSYMK